MKKFPWIFSILWLGILLVMLWAGLWQLGRADEKNKINSKLENNYINKPLTEKQWQNLSAFDLIEVKGKYSDLHLLLDNQIVESQVGYFVYSAFQTSAGPWILVNRGWTQDKQQALKAGGGKTTLKGLLADWPRPGIQLGEQNIKDQAVQTVTYLPQEKVKSILENRLCGQVKDKPCVILSSVLKLDSQNDNGFIRKWQLPRMTAEKHQAYAVQWFTMSLVLCLIYMVFLKRIYSS